MKRLNLFFALFCIIQSAVLCAQTGETRISTPWAEKVDPSHVLDVYPRPQLVRNNWVNLNGSWDYSILPKSAETIPASFDGKILVPFAIESSLSGVNKEVGKDNVLWYNRTFSVPANIKNKEILLHFGAVDWHCEVFVNGKKAGEHKGGFDPFSFEISSLLKSGKQQQLTVRVWDPTDDGPQPRGKQVKKPEGIWYTPVTGIWQTVWLEVVPKTYIVSTRQTPDLDKQTLAFSAETKNLQKTDIVKVTAWDGKTLVAEQTIEDGKEIMLSINNPKIWSPENPFLYDLKVSVLRNGKAIDEVKSYFAMRKISLAPDQNGIQRMMLNNRFVFQYGPLDQGWWPDGLYTAPTDEALKFDIEKTKEMGFNMIRKHTKVEPARWYYHCDQLGILVWQDMPTGDLGGGRWENRPGIENSGADRTRTPESENIFRTEWKEIMNDLYNFPSIVTWVPFNEAWGQFKTVEITKWTMQQDPSRLVNSASGGNFHPVGHIIDLHNYPEPAMPSPDLFGAKQAIVLGEFGGLGLPLDGHTWQNKNNWGYQNFKDADVLYERYASFMNRLEYLIPKGLSAAVYTQTTDVEGEVNGLITYDRKIFKIPVEKLKAIHSKLYNSKVEVAKK